MAKTNACSAPNTSATAHSNDSSESTSRNATAPNKKEKSGRVSRTSDATALNRKASSSATAARTSDATAQTAVHTSDATAQTASSQDATRLAERCRAALRSRRSPRSSTLPTQKTAPKFHRAAACTAELAPQRPFGSRPTETC